MNTSIRKHCEILEEEMGVDFDFLQLSSEKQLKSVSEALSKMMQMMS
jgi:hypothetical protein